MYLHEGQRLGDECDREELIKKGHRSTLLKAFRREQVTVAARRPCEKPQRTPEHEVERYGVAKTFTTKPPHDYVKELDLTIDNKTLDVPTAKRARLHLKAQQIRCHLRTPAARLPDVFTGPGRRKDNMNTGAKASVCAAIADGRVVV